jgi:hypothetical protein
MYLAEFAPSLLVGEGWGEGVFAIEIPLKMFGI